MRGILTRTHSFCLLGLSGLGLVLGCGGADEGSSGDTGLAAEITALAETPRETFRWSDQPISFAPLSEPWARNRKQSGGQLGVYFVKKGSVGERIGVGEYHRVAGRDRCVELVELLRDLDTLSDREFASRLSKARPITSNPVNAEETLAFRSATESLDQARKLHREDDLEGVRRYIASAISQLSWVEYDLDEVVDDVLFDGAGYEREGRIEIQPPRDAIVAGKPARVVDYTLFLKLRGILYHGREVYFVHGNHLFTGSFLGLEENLPLFDAVLETITFPKGECVR